MDEKELQEMREKIRREYAAIPQEEKERIKILSKYITKTEAIIENSVARANQLSLYRLNEHECNMHGNKNACKVMKESYELIQELQKESKYIETWKGV